MDRENNKQVVVIGAGPAGLSAAYQLRKASIHTTVIEKDYTIGGLSRTVNYKGYYFDIGGHRFFTKLLDVKKLWHKILGDEFLLRRRRSSIYFNTRFFSYPLKPLNALKGLGVCNSLLVIGSYVKAKVFPFKEEQTFEQWVSNRFGKRLFKIFFKTYTEKVWGISCQEISAEWASQRIKGLSLFTALKNALMNKSSALNRKAVIKTLIKEFHYPKLGPGMMWEKIADIVQENGGCISLGSEVKRIHWSDNKIDWVEVAQAGGIRKIDGTDFISSMPLNEVVQKLYPPPPKTIQQAAALLRYRDFITVVIIIRKPHVFSDNWIYIHEPHVKVGRIQNYKNWSPFMVPDQDMTSLGLEYFCFEGDALWTMTDDELIEMGKQELNALGIAKVEDMVDGTVVRMPKAYPLYDHVYRDALQIICNFLSNLINFQTIGRNGQHKYNNQDHSMLTAFLAVENILGAKHDIWQVNVDPDYHEELEISQDNQEKIRLAFARMDKLAFATAIGSVSGLLVLSATIVAVLKPDPMLIQSMGLLEQFFKGYSVSIPGAFIGMAYCFVWGFIFSWLFAYLRNLFLSYYIYRAKRKLEFMRFVDFMKNF